MTLPPGQRRVDGFPRFGTHLQEPPPVVPDDPAIEVEGPLRQPLSIAVADLASLPRTELVADFHCVAGWSATDLRWEGVAFTTLWHDVISPALRPDAGVTHLAFGGLDGYRSFVLLEDALAADVLVADRRDGRPLDGDHGAPARLVSPSQYGFISTKHLSRIELHASEPPGRYHPVLFKQLGLQAVKPHARARVWHEERHRYIPARIVRPVYRLLIGPIRSLAGRRRGRERP